jgi:hypothetical protein
VPDHTFQWLIQQVDGRMIVLSDTGFHAAEGDPANLKLCQRGEWQDRMLVETVQTWPKDPLHQCGNNRLSCALAQPRHRPGREARQGGHNVLCMYDLSLNHNYTQISEAFSSPTGVR